MHAHEPGALAEELEALTARGFRTPKVKAGLDAEKGPEHSGRLERMTTTKERFSMVRTGSGSSRAGLMDARTLRSSPLLPLLLLLAALSTVFLTTNDRGHFFRAYGPHAGMTFAHLPVAANLSPEHHFLGFLHQTLDADGAPTYKPFNRFPIGGYALIKLSMMPFEDDLWAQIHAAQVLMLLLFVATAALAWLSLCRLTSHRWIAFSATLLSFSSTYWLYLNEMVTTEMGPDLFGVMLVFHGMVIFVQEGRFRQLLFRTCIALLLGWHVYALLLSFIVLSLARDMVRVHPADGGGSLRARLLRRRFVLVRPTAAGLLSNRCVMLGVVALLFGGSVLTFNFANEYVALEKGLTQLPSVRSMGRRLGFSEKFNTINAEQLAWGRFVPKQFHRIAGMTLPYSLPGGYVNTFIKWPGERSRGLQSTTTGIIVFGVCLVGLAFVRHKILWATLLLFGFCWSFPMRHVTYMHNFEALSYTGVPLVFFSLVFLYLYRSFGSRAIKGLSAAALLIFLFSGVQMARVGYSDEAAEFYEAAVADFETIRRMTKGHVVFIPQNPVRGAFAVSWRGTYFFLTGSVILTPVEGNRHLADFVIEDERVPGPALLTPENRLMFLYDRVLYDRQRESGASGG